MEDGLAVKINALDILEKQLASRAKKGQYGFVAVGSATDAYINHEDKYRLTEGMLRLLLKYRFPVFISTKRTLITRDLELLHAIDTNAILPADLSDKLSRGLILSVSISSLDEKIASMLEPGAVPPLRRLELVSELKQQGFLVGVNAIPVLPFISDSEEELEKIISAASDHRADYILIGGLTLFGNAKADSKTLYYKFVERYNAALLPKYKELYGNNFYAPYAYQDKLKQRAKKLCEEYGIKNSILD